MRTRTFVSSQRLTDHLLQHPDVGASLGRDESTIKPLHMAVNGWAEEARAVAQPTLLSLGGFGQNDVVALNFLAWQKASAAARCLDAVLAGLAVVASQAVYTQDRQPSPRLQPLVNQVREYVAPVGSGASPRPLGREILPLVTRFTAEAVGDTPATVPDHV